MKKKIIECTIHEYQDLNELSKDDAFLIEKAINASSDAYAPYSEFNVGAAALLDNGEVVVGNNQENAAYPSGICAERVAVFYANSKYPNSKILTVAIAAHTKNGITEKPVPACGACLQVLLESEQRFQSDIKIILIGKEVVYIANSVKEFLPLNFSNKFLDKD